jgi:hypothetical protein
MIRKIIAVTLFLLVFFTGCDEEEDYSVGAITITGIPEEIPVMGNENVRNKTYKVYLNASNSQSENDTPVAKGVALVSEGTLTGGKYTVTIQLQNPNPPDNDDPTNNTGPWSGTANYFSIVISPQDVSAGVETIWAKAGLALDKGKKNTAWDSLMDFRVDPEDKLGFKVKTKALFDLIVCKDKDTEMQRPE